MHEHPKLPEAGEADFAPQPGCRFCGAHLDQLFADLGMSPLANAYLHPTQLNSMEPFYPLRAYVCADCFLVQLEAFQHPRHIFSTYAYFSSYSTSWLQHAQTYVAAMLSRFAIDEQSLVVEVGSNDGYLLQYFVEQHIPVLGIDPAENIVAAARRKGIPTTCRFFGLATASELRREGVQADLLVANNVLAHVPDVNDFVAGLKQLLKPQGVLSVEFPHLLRLVEENQFDTIYHEHFSYFSLFTVEKIFQHHQLTIFDSEELSTHGGSLRIYACHDDDSTKTVSRRVQALKAVEAEAGIASLDLYRAFNDRVRATKRALLSCLIAAQQAGQSLVAYGAPAKGNTLLNFCGIGTDFVGYTVDRSPHKQGLFLPGTHIPILHPRRIQETQPDYVLILPWNLREEIMQDLVYIREWGGRFIVPIPVPEVC